MDSHVTAGPAEHTHPTAGLYFKVGLILFVLTALEVGLYEITYGEHASSFAPTIKPLFVPLLLLLSAAKFALVAMFYMHLKQDHKLFSGRVRLPAHNRDVHYRRSDRSSGVPLRLRESGVNARRAVRPTAPFEWSWSLHPSVIIGTGLLGALYFYGIGPYRRRHGHPPASPWQVLSFSGSLRSCCWC